MAPAFEENMLEHHGTIYKWLSKESRREWSEKTLLKIQNCHALSGSGRTGVLSKHPEIVAMIKTTFKDMRKSEMPINIILGRSIMLAIIQRQNPSILNKKFKCSEKYIRAFMQSVMDYTPRKATCAAAHIPIDAPDQCEGTFFCLVYAILWKQVPLKLVINLDQAGVDLLPNGSYTFYDCGAAQVNVAGKDEKRAFTLLVASTASGELLPFQQVWGRASDRSLPSYNAPGMVDA